MITSNIGKILPVNERLNFDNVIIFYFKSSSLVGHQISGTEFVFNVDVFLLHRNVQKLVIFSLLTNYFADLYSNHLYHS